MIMIVFAAAFMCMILTGNSCTLTVTPTKSFFDSYINRVGKDINRLIAGCKEFIPTFMEVERLKDLRKKSGEAALSFSDFKKIEVVNNHNHISILSSIK